MGGYMFTRRGFLQCAALGMGAALGPMTAQQNPPNPKPANPPPPTPLPGPHVVVVGIVLAGGGAKGSFEVGALRYLYDHGVRPNIICGTSVGAINAIKLAEGEGASTQGLSGLESIWLGLNRNEDMYTEGPWLQWLGTNKRSVYSALQQNAPFLIASEAEGFAHIIATPQPNILAFLPLLPLALTLPGLLLGIAAAIGGPLVEAVINGLITCTDLQDTVNSLNQLVPQYLYDLSPIGRLLQAHLDLTLVQKWVASGGKLRLAAVGLGSGNVRYVTESGQLIERDTSAVVYQFPSLPNNPLVPDLVPGVMASAALPAFFPPVNLGGEIYVDGGIRDVMPVARAVELGANVVYAINDSPPLPIDSSFLSNFSGKTFMDIAQRSVLGIALDEIVHESSTSFQKTNQVHVNVIQCTYAKDLDTIQIHPALIRINISYGYMRADDTVNSAATLPARRFELSDEITKLRRLLFEFEWRCIPELSGGTANLQVAVPMLRWGKGMLQLLIHERENLGGAIPTDVYSSFVSWEQHIVAPPATNPFQAIGPVPADINVADFIPANRTLLREENAPFLSPFWPETYIILGGAKFLVSSQQIAIALGLSPVPTIQTVPTSSIACLARIPWEGTLIKEVNSAQIFLIQNGQKCAVSQTAFNNHHFDPASVLICPNGSLASIPSGPDLTS